MKKLLQLAFVVVLCAGGFAQVSTSHAIPSVEEIVARVQRNVQEFRASLPDFLCDERITSQVIVDGKIKQDTRVQSIFRAIHNQGANDYAESRQIETVNGKRAKTQELNLPFGVMGGFSKATAVLFSPQSIQCFDFRVIGTDTVRGRTAFVLTATTKANVESLGPACASHKPNRTTRVWIDAEAMQVVRIESATVHSNESQAAFIDIPWPEDLLLNWTANYDKVTIEGKTFWMPMTVQAELASSTKPRKMTYFAEYGDYHKFGTKSRVLPVPENARAK